MRLQLQHDLQREVMQHISRSLQNSKKNNSLWKSEQIPFLLVGDLSLNWAENMLWAHDFKITQWLELYTFHIVSLVTRFTGAFLVWETLNAAR